MIIAFSSLICLTEPKLHHLPDHPPTPNPYHQFSLYSSNYCKLKFIHYPLDFHS